MRSKWLFAGAALAAAGLFLLLPVFRSAVPEMDLGWLLPMARENLEGKSAAGVAWFLLSPAPINLGQPILKVYLYPAAMWGWPVQSLMAIALALHLANAWLISDVGRRLGLPSGVAKSAGLVYLCLFAHFHAVFWPVASQHVVALFTILAVLWLYLRGSYGWMLAAGILASLGRSAFLGPVLIFTHIAATSSGAGERLRRFDRCLPLFLVYIIYPAAMLSFTGDIIINESIVRMPAPPPLKMAALLALGAAALAVARQSLLLSRKAARALLWAAAGGVWAVLFLKDHRQLFLPYNAWVPWTALWTSFLDPFRSALGTDSTEPYHYLPAQISLFSMGLSALGAWLFLKAFAAEKKGLWLLPVWYGVCLIHVLNHYGSFPVRVPSRYFTYLSPVFAWVFCAAGWWVADNIGKWAGWSGGLRRSLCALVLVVLCAANLLAIRLELFRGRLANTYLSYEELRAGQDSRQEPESYAELGLKSLDFGDREGAALAFRQGVERRPFLLRYLLGDCRLSDARWMTGGQSLREWLEQVASKFTAGQVSPADKALRIREGMERELRDYGVCLLGLSVLDGKWASQLYSLERDPARLKSWLGNDERVRGRKALLEVLEKLQGPAVFGDPLPWRQDDYGFGRFMVRLISGVDIRSHYDRAGLVP